jgi:hypothetical protein
MNMTSRSINWQTGLLYICVILFYDALPNEKITYRRLICKGDHEWGVEKNLEGIGPLPV